MNNSIMEEKEVALWRGIFSTLEPKGGVGREITNFIGVVNSFGGKYMTCHWS